jgi:hypothetical protein
LGSQGGLFGGFWFGRMARAIARFIFAGFAWHWILPRIIIIGRKISCSYLYNLKAQQHECVDSQANYHLWATGWQEIESHLLHFA